MSLTEIERGDVGGRCCSEEEIFELCEGSLGSERERAVRSHLRCCTVCRSLHEREMSLSAVLYDSGRREQTTNSGVPRAETAYRVAMALPTRSVIARVVWAAGAATLLAAALVSLVLHSVLPITYITDFMAICWGLTSSVSDVAGILLAVSGSTILIALIVGALVDALIAAVLLAVAHWWRPRGA